MHGMAGCAGNAILVVGGTHEFALLRIGFVAGHATLGDGFRPGTCVDEDLGLIAATLHMGRPRAMARLAAMGLFAPDLGQESSVMRARIDVLELIFVAGPASVKIGRASCRERGEIS